MASGGSWKTNYCPQCKKQVEILNGDLQFSMNLHYQSHKSLETIEKEIDQGMKNIKVGSKRWDYTCPECKENVVIFNNDVKLSLQIHSQRHKAGVQSRSDDHSSTSSVKSKSSEKKTKPVFSNSPIPKVINILDGIFDSMPPGLKLHRGFVCESENGQALCNICNTQINSMFNISEHLKTKLHEDKTITFFTNLLPPELHHEMEFVSFYGSNLCCNLCRIKIDLCSDNAYKTIISIISHNSCKDHLQNKKTDDPSCNSDLASIILRSISKINPVVNNNKHHVECKMQPQFKCKLCDKNIAYDKNEKDLYQNFNSHFTSKGHEKCAQATSVFEAFKLSHFPGREKHNLSVSKGNIYCSICNCYINANIQELIAHVKELPGSGLQVGTQTPNSAKGSQEDVTSLKRLIMSLPPQLRNTNCLAQGIQGQVKCLVCNNGFPATTENVTGHLLGKSHKNKVGEVNPCIQSSRNELTTDLVALKNLFDELPVALKKDIRFIRPFSKEKLHCSVCNFDVPAHPKFLKDHLEGAVHLNSVKEYESAKFEEQRKQQVSNTEDLLEKLKKTDLSVKICAKYFIFNGQQYKCRLCNQYLPKSKDEQTLHMNIMSHISKKNHRTNFLKEYDSLLDRLEKSDPFVKTDRLFLQNQQGSIYCKLCSISISASIEFESFKINLLSHLTGNQHKGNLKKMNEAERNPPPPLIPKTRNEPSSNNLKVDFLNSLPVRFQGDIQFLKPSTVAGFVSCTLCNNVINYQYLREHLEDQNHFHKKFLQQTMSEPNANGDPALIRNMGTMISLLGNIDKKLSWQGK